MGNTKYDDKFYRLPKRLFKDDQFRSITNEAKTLYMIFNKMLRELEAHNLIYQSHQGLGNPHVFTEQGINKNL